MKHLTTTVDTTNLRGHDTPLLMWADNQIAPYLAFIRVWVQMRHVEAIISTEDAQVAGTVRINVSVMSSGDHLADFMVGVTFKRLVQELCDGYYQGVAREGAPGAVEQIEKYLQSEVHWGDAVQIHARGEAQYELARDRLRAKGICSNELKSIDAQVAEIQLMLNEKVQQEEEPVPPQ